MLARLGDFLYGAGCTLAVLSLGAVALIIFVPGHDFGGWTDTYALTGIAAWPIGMGARRLLGGGRARDEATQGSTERKAGQPDRP
ncbi:hypothetical protein [Dongia sp. agr-C8]